MTRSKNHKKKHARCSFEYNRWQIKNLPRIKRPGAPFVISDKYTFYEFFAGGGMARAGLGKEWECLFANDVDELKATTYISNWGRDHFDDRDVRKVTVDDLDGHVDLAWASFPCQDLSLAGNGLGIGRADDGSETRSGALWPFLTLMENLRRTRRHPTLLVLENVVGLLTLDGGRDFAAICDALGAIGYRYGAVVADAKHFVPQSRPRVFLIAVRREQQVNGDLCSDGPTEAWHTQPLIRAFDALSSKSQKDWIWWDAGTAPKLRKNSLLRSIDLDAVGWDSAAETKRLLDMMSPAHLARLHKAQAEDGPHIGSLYLRMRREGEKNRQRAEIAFGPTLGCLRTPRGGASRPRIIHVEGKTVRTRLLTVTEAAKLMGLAQNYVLPDVYYRAFKVIGDGVVVPVVRFLADRLLEPIAAKKHQSGDLAA
ncbi:DNA cytosine methyltransferase [Paraburkholderia sabiae]|uniref:DNA (cytosine-5-)-methyltransferase n=1 Tax=Paraburkholderia sabiae TaxID=273251 RepID=A0ABU9QL23_9BURK|nr:DNA cytosine methyltransferase [Paraburkholderia sabiae]WJZ77379.1 DNA cytosine methyltransferase [Paraburkholderia sabiae]CAD6547529.1 Modification methylase HpaII [Paraburkholderia sabiae]